MDDASKGQNGSRCVGAIVENAHMKIESEVVENRPRERLVDSPWFWICLFASVAVMGLVAIGPKYRQREARLETQLRMRDHLARGNHTTNSVDDAENTPSAEAGGDSELLKTTGPLIWILAIVVAGAWGVLIWSRRTIPVAADVQSRPSP